MQWRYFSFRVIQASRIGQSSLERLFLYIRYFSGSYAFLNSFVLEVLLYPYRYLQHLERPFSYISFHRCTCTVILAHLPRVETLWPCPCCMHFKLWFRLPLKFSLYMNILSSSFNAISNLYMRRVYERLLQIQCYARTFYERLLQIQCYARTSIKYPVVVYEFISLIYTASSRSA